MTLTELLRASCVETDPMLITTLHPKRDCLVRDLHLQHYLTALSHEVSYFSSTK